MDLNAQIEFLTRLGERLDNWVSPGDAEAQLAPGVALIDGPVAAMQFPMRVVDVLKARWIRVKDYRTQKPVPLFIGPAQRDFSARRTGQDVILKSGKTLFTTDAIASAFLRTITRPGHGALLVAHELDPAKDYFMAARFMHQMLPGPLGKMLRAGALSTKAEGGRGNVRELFFPHLNSRYFVETAKDASAGLGQSYQDLHCTELSRWPGDVKQTLSTLTTHQVGIDRRDIRESRPFGDTGFFHNFYWQAKHGENGFRAHFYPFWCNPMHALPAPAGFARTEDEEKLQARYAAWRDQHSETKWPTLLSDGQLAWRRKQYVENADLTAQEFAEDEIACFLGSGDCPFSAWALNEILKRSTSALEAEIQPGGEENGWLCWELPEKRVEYVMFADVAGGEFISRLALEVIRRDTGAQVGEWVGREGEVAFAERCNRIGRRFNNATLAVEVNLGIISAEVMSHLTKLGYPRLFRRRSPEGDYKLGWKTDPATRPGMFDLLGQTISAAPGLFHSRRLVADMKLHVRNGDRIEPKAGHGGDLTIAAGGALCVRSQLAGRRTGPIVEVMDIGPPRGRAW